jgi:osmoprotectant transport system ATP-binding protein
VDADGVLRGSVVAEDAAGDGTVRDHQRRFEAWVPADGTLQDALSMMLLTEAGWVAVLDGARFVGILTPEAVFRSLRRSLGDDGHGT